MDKIYSAVVDSLSLRERLKNIEYTSFKKATPSQEKKLKEKPSVDVEPKADSLINLQELEHLQE
jgi:hypothetical protein